MNFIRRYHKKLLFAIQFVVSIVLLISILIRLDFHLFSLEFTSLDLAWYILFLIVYLLSIFLVAFKWWRLLYYNGFTLSFFHIFKINWIGFFYNQFLPGRIGGDVLKIVYIMRDESEKSKISMSVVMDRIYNILGILLVSYVAIFINFYGSREYMIPVAIVTVSIILLYSVALLTTKYYPSYQNSQKVIRWLVTILVSLSDYFRNSRANPQMIALALAYVVVTIVMHYILGKALGINLPFTYFLFFVPLITAITIVPISFGGLGIREVSFAILLGQVGISNEKAVAFSIILYVTMVFFSIPGFFFQFFTHKQNAGYVLSE